MIHFTPADTRVGDQLLILRVPVWRCYYQACSHSIVATSLGERTQAIVDHIAYHMQQVGYLAAEFDRVALVEGRR